MKFHCFNIILSVCIASLLFSTCNSDNSIREGKIEYAISYPCLESTNNQVRIFLPKKMVTTFKDHCYKNEFIFPGEIYKLELISECQSKKTKLGFALGTNRIYTELDSNSISELLKELPVYKKIGSKIEEGVYLNQPYNKYKVKSSHQENEFDVITTDAISIDNVNWCTPFHEFDEVLLEYSLYQYGLDMKFKATDIIDVPVKDDFLKMSTDYHHEEFKKYIAEIKSLMKNFSCE